MVKAAQKVLFDIRRDLFAHLQTLPLRFFDTQPPRRRHELLHQRRGHHLRRPEQQLRHGDPELYPGGGHADHAVHPQLAALAGGGRVLSGHVPRISASAASAARPTTPSSRPAWATWTATSRRWWPGRRWSRSLTTRRQTSRPFREKNEALRKAGTGAQAYAATMVPAVVSISYINYAIVAVLGGIMAMQGHDRRGQPGQLPGLCAPGRRCPSTSSPSRATSCWRPWPARSGSSRPWTRRRRWTRAACVWCVVDENGGDRRERAAAGPGGSRTARWCLCGATCGLNTSTFGYEPGHPILQGHQPLRQARPEDRLCGLHRRRQDHHHQPHQPLLRRAARAG